MIEFESKREVLTSIIPVGDYKRTRDTLLNWIHSTDFSDNWLRIILIFSGPNRSLEFIQASNDFSNLIKLEHVSIYQSDASGPGAGRNEGLRRSNSKFVSFWDDDDIPEIQTIKSIVSGLNPNVVSVGQFRKLSSCGLEVITPFRTSSLNYLASYPGIWRMIFPRHLILDYRFGESMIAEDHEFLHQLLSGLVDFEFVNLIYYNYVSQPNSLSQNINTCDLEEMFFLLVRRINFPSKRMLPRIVSVIALGVSSLIRINDSSSKVNFLRNCFRVLTFRQLVLLIFAFPLYCIQVVKRKCL